MSFISKHWRLIATITVPVVVAAMTVFGLTSLLKKQIATVGTSSPQVTVKNETTKPVEAATVSVEGLQLDASKQYGNKYANGLLPVGDSQYSLSSAAQGKVLLCHVPNGGEGGAGTRGPWFTNNNTQYDINKKAKVSGSISWNGSYSMVVANGKRVITTNDLPGTHTTGVFPIASKDVAYLYDRNPNSIKTQSLSYSLSANPTYQATPGCMGGEVGIMTTGVALFDAFDAGGRDAGAWEVQDSCGGHPQKDGEYHYHTLSSCITDVSIQKVIGYALDGYPITGPTISAGNVLSTSDLDECHGIVSSIVLDGQTVLSYHYVMTQDFPYSVSCFRSTATNAPH